MSKSKSELSVSERLLLDYIRFRTKSGFPFFEKNSTIAPNVGLTESTTKELINRLVRKGYLFKCKDEKNRRQLMLTELKHTQVYQNFQDIGNKELKEEVKHLKQELKTAEKRLQEKDYAIDVWQTRYNAEHQKVLELQGEIEMLKNVEREEFQDDYFFSAKKESANNDESIVRVSRMNGETTESNIRDPKQYVEDIMKKYKQLNPNQFDHRQMINTYE